VTLEITDGADVALDRTGLYTEGAVTTSFVLSWLGVALDGAAGEYTSYITQTQTSPITDQSADQATTDSAGSYAEIGVGQGTFTYTLGKKIAVVDPLSTHTLAIYATRTVDGVRYVANAEYDFLPGGGEPTVKQEMITDATCNACHGQLSAHGGSRRDVKLCMTCHTSQSVDPDTGNSLDFKVMIHKLHRGVTLPSVVGGTPYQLIGLDQAVADYSTVAFPQDIRNCTSCHSGAQEAVWSTRPTRAACGSCHDRTWFDAGALPAGWTQHVAGPQATDAFCALCHPPSGGISGIIGEHQVVSSPQDLALAITSVSNTSPGQAPTIGFTVSLNGSPYDISSTPLTSLRATMAGPTIDYTTAWLRTIQGSGAVGTLTPAGTPGAFYYTFPAASAVPVTATGSYAFGMEGSITVNGTVFHARNPVIYAAVTDATAVARRQVVDTDKCNACHKDLTAHNTRNTAEYCILCHNPERTNWQYSPHLEGSAVTPISMDFKVLIHKIHRGENLQQPYAVGASPLASSANPYGTQMDFGGLRYPGQLGDCQGCHLPNTELLPLAANVRSTRYDTYTCTEDPSADADSYCPDAARTITVTSYTTPAQSVCTSCHDGTSAVAHAQLNTTALGVESCATCHGPGQAFDAASYHQQSRLQ